ncbi:phage late control D family protein [Laribacter hongkongensis]|uniref:phage late control D family protein n=1 Tax=Laribacter hongkongensis TaxID=168471 RepID=UPI001EFCCBD3|nr:phage late control D family protein [Laribacter hongkongensis]MCG9100474.1 phage late control D family protein [Laribacter hongkongensis]MCG9113291.1 phage late control D family protein [Laribacter hongkongensis]
MNLSDLLGQGEALARSAADKTAELADRVMDMAGADRLLQPVYCILLHKGKERRDITANFDSRLMSLSLTDNRGFESDQVDIVLDDADGQLDLPPRGGIISVQLGWKGRPLIDKGSYTVDEVEHSGAPDILTIRARATDLRAGMATKREKSWHKTTVGKVVGEIAKANGLTPAVPDWLARRPVAHMDQTSESDANLLTRLAGQHDAVATVKAGRLIFCKAGDAESVTGKPFPKVVITRASGDQHRFAVADRNAYTAVKAYWHDLDKAAKGEVVVDANTKFERRAGVTKRGKPTKRKKLTPVQMAAMEPSSANVKVLRHIYASETTAIQAAKAAWEKIQRGVAEFSITLAHGRPELFPELPARVEGFKPSIDGCDWIVSRVCHTLDDNGLITRIELEMKLEDVAG